MILTDHSRTTIALTSNTNKDNIILSIDVSYF